MKQILKQSVGRGAGDSFISSELDTPSKYGEIGRSIVGYLMRTPTTTAPIT